MYVPCCWGRFNILLLKCVYEKNIIYLSIFNIKGIENYQLQKRKYIFNLPLTQANRGLNATLNFYYSLYISILFLPVLNMSSGNYFWMVNSCSYLSKIYVLVVFSVWEFAFLNLRDIFFSLLFYVYVKGHEQFLYWTILNYLLNPIYTLSTRHKYNLTW